MTFSLKIRYNTEANYDGMTIFIQQIIVLGYSLVLMAQELIGTILILQLMDLMTDTPKFLQIQMVGLVIIALGKLHL